MKKIIILILSALALGACAISSSDMTPISEAYPKINPAFKNKIEAWKITVVPQGIRIAAVVDQENYRMALKNALIKAGYARSSRERARYSLDAEITTIDRPWFVFYTMTTKITAHYKLYEMDSNKMVFDKVITTSGTGNSIIGAESNRIATSAAVQNNIMEFIMALSTKNIGAK